jgi:branched-chain amino acid aminotransferase
MTSTLTFSHTASSDPATPERVAEVLAHPGFGTNFTDHMVTVRWTAGRGWHDAAVEPYRPFNLDPATSVLHYGQAIFEGLKAYRQPDGTIASFRPDMNAARFQRSARRLAIPELPESVFLDSLRELIAVDGRWVPEAEGASLYLRPFIISTEAGLGVNRPASSYLYTLIASPAGSYFAGGVKPVSLWISADYARAAPGGTGEAKCAGNYAASFLPQARAVEQGCDQVVYLDATEHRWVEELGGMNLFFVFGAGASAHLVTPELTGTLLPGVTRDSLITLAQDFGHTVEQRRVSAEEWEKSATSGELTEVFACGTAAVITPVGSVKSHRASWTVGDGSPGAVTMRLREELLAIQTGHAEDRHGWMLRLDA